MLPGLRICRIVRIRTQLPAYVFTGSAFAGQAEHRAANEKSCSRKGMGIRMDYFNAFWVGGAICALVQILLEKTKLMPGRVMVLLVCTGAVISFFGWYEPFMEYAGAGASVPLLGYGNILMKGVREAIDESGFIGLFQGGFKTGAVGCCAALVFGYLASLIFKPRMKG